MATRTEIRESWKPEQPLPNPNWEAFCRLYATGTEFFGNGTQSYIEAFPRKEGQRPMSALAARAMASRLLTNANILARINALLDLHLNNEIVDKNLGIVVLQNADFKAKVAAIKEYNQLKRRVSNPRINIFVVNAEVKDRAQKAIAEII